MKSVYLRVFQVERGSFWWSSFCQTEGMEISSGTEAQGSCISRLTCFILSLFIKYKETALPVSSALCGLVAKWVILCSLIF